MLSTLLLLAGLTVHLPAEVHVTGTELTVGAVAHLESGDEALRSEVASLSLGYSPAPGYSRLIWAHQLESLVQVRFPEVAVALAGESACRVWPKTRTVGAEAIRAAAERELLQWIGERDATYELRQPIVGATVPEGASEPVLTVRPRRDQLRTGVVNLAVRIEVDGELYQTVWTNWQVTLWEVVPVLRRRVRPGERLTSELLEERRMKREPGGESEPLAGELLVGAIAKRELAPRAVVTHADVERPIIVQRGDNLFVQVRKGNIQARVAAVARAAGALGDSISVICRDSDQELTGRIVRAGLIDVDLNAVHDAAPNQTRTPASTSQASATSR